MRYAPHLGLRQPDGPLFRHSVGTADPVRQIEYASELGFAGVQDNFLKIRSIEKQVLIDDALRHFGLAMGSFVNSVSHWNAPLWGSQDAAAFAQIEADLRESIEAAQRVGGSNVTVTSGRDPAVPLRYQHIAMTEKLKRLADQAARGGVVLAIEATNERFLPGMLVNHVADALAIVRAVDHPAVRLVFDIAHVHSTDGEIIPNLRACYDSIAVIQVADNPGRVDLGRGEINWVNVLRFIRDQGYLGLIELEHLPSEAGSAGEQALLERLAAIDTAL
jgi:hydroxypyruvate isomerase